MTDIETTERLTRLEMLFSEQEHTIQSLNDIVVQQTRQISKLSSDLQALKQQYQELKSELPGEFSDNEKPPHY
jgi:SlyX protein